MVRLVDNLGDLLIAIPVFRELKRNFPNATITAAVRKSQRTLLSGYADAFMPPVKKESLSRYTNRFDFVLNVAYSFPDNYKPGKLKRGSVNHIGTPDWSKGQHVYKNLLDGLKSYGLSVSYNRPRIVLSPETKAESNLWIKKNGLSTKDSFIVAVNAGSGFKYKRWPLDNFVRLCKWLIAEFDAKILVVSQNRRDWAAHSLHARLPVNHRFWLHDYEIDVVAAVLSRIDLCIGNDSGIGHLASVVNAPTVTIFGPTSARLWQPVGKQGIIITNANAGCQCGYEKAKVCRHKRCFKEISPTNFADAILICLSTKYDRTKKDALNRITPAENIRLEMSGRNTCIYNENVRRPFIVKKGKKCVLKIIEAARKHNCLSELYKRFPRDKHLIDFLLLHRIIISASSKKYNRNV